jgi:hypothetical protein
MVTQPKLEIIGSVDGTTVTILPSNDIVAGTGVAGATHNVAATYNVDKGQVLQFEQDAELTGSIIQATQNVAVFGAQDCVTIDYPACDSEHQQLAPVRTLGSEYAAVRYHDRWNDGAHVENNVPWRIVGAVNGTTLTYTPSTPAAAPTTIDKGQVVTFRNSGYFTVASQDNNHPFYLGYHMTGGGVGAPWSMVTMNSDYNPGDPEWQNMVPPAEWLSSYVFFMDPTYRDSSLVFIRKQKADGSFDDVTLDCAGVLTGWQPITGSTYEYTYRDMAISFAGVSGCYQGVHVATSNSSFGLSVWGWANNSSYGYPAGMSIRAVNGVVVPPNPN